MDKPESGLTLRPLAYIVSDVGKLVLSMEELTNNTPGSPIERLEKLERVTLEAARLAGDLYGKALVILYQFIIKPGLWKLKKRQDGELYTREQDYIADIMADIRGMEERTIFSRIGQMQTMDELGLSLEDQARVLSTHPSVAERALAVGEYAPDGTFKGLDPSRRQAIEEVLGITPEESPHLSDKEVLKEFAVALPELSSREAGRVVAQVTREWKHQWRWLANERMLVMRVFQVSGKRGTRGERYFKLQSQSNLKIPTHSRDNGKGKNLEAEAELDRWLKSLMG